MIDLTEYRKEFRSFQSRIELYRYELRTVHPHLGELERIAELFAHLFDRKTVVELFELAGATDHLSETERAARKALAAASAKVFVDRAVREYEEECRRCEASAGTDWNGKRSSLERIPENIADEPERSARIDLEHRWLRALRNCADLRLDLIEARHAATEELGSDSKSKMGSEARMTDLEDLTHMAAGFLELTEKRYFLALARLRERDGELKTDGPWAYSDLLRWRRLARFDRLFPRAAISPALSSALSKLRIDLDQQPNLRIEIFDPAESGFGTDSLFRIDPPADVRLTLPGFDGAGHFQRAFEMMGRAQHQAWTSAGMSGRYPEFVYTADSATSQAFGELLGNLHLDRSWVGELYARGNDETAGELVREFALLALSRIREDCAHLLFLTDHSTSNDLAAESTRGEYGERMRSAIGFGAADLAYLWNSNGPYGAADRLRAIFFETHFSEYLRSNYGNRWWADRKASDELRDVWNTGSRYSVEELAGSLGLGEIGYEATADRLSALIT